LKQIVIENKMVSYEYFMDRMQPYEITLLSDMIPWASKIQAENTRLVMWSVLSPYMKNKPKTIEKFWPLITDIEQTKEKMLSDEQANKVREMIKKNFKNMKSKK